MLLETENALKNLAILKHPHDPPIVTFENLDPVARQYVKSQSLHQNMTKANF